MFSKVEKLLRLNKRERRDVVCEMCLRRGTSREIHTNAYETTATFLGGFEMPFSMVYTMHEACVNSEHLRRVNA